MFFQNVNWGDIVNINKINSLWNKTRIWEYVLLLSNGKTEDAKRRFDYVPNEYKNTSIEFDMFNFEKKEVQNLIVSNIKSWEEYKEYIESFSSQVQDILYELDLFDSAMCRKFF